MPTKADRKLVLRTALPTACAAVPMGLLRARFRFSTCHMYRPELSDLSASSGACPERNIRE